MAVVLLLAGQPLGAAPAAEAPEYKIKAVFLFYFTQFVEWPPEAFPDVKTSFVIGILGDDPFGSDLEDAVRGEKVNDHPILVRHFGRVEDVDVCHILFVSRSKSDELRHVLTGLKARSILTVSDIDGFGRLGGMIRFLTDQNKVRLRINLSAVKAAGMQISSKLLRRAEIVTSADD
jgi:hypothetical protein